MKRMFFAGCGLFMSVLLLAGCTRDDKVVVDPPIPAAPKLIKLQTSPTLGSYLVDKDNRALYYFSSDANGKNNCAGGCEAVWPPFYADSLQARNLNDSLSFTDFTATVTASGKKQLVYKGWPLYYYAPSVGGVNTPEAPGLTTGENVGGVWFVAKPTYTIMLANAQLIGHDGKTYKSDYTVGTGKTIYFTDGNGLTLYAYNKDKYNKNNYTKPDFSNNATWPVYEQDKIVVPSTLDSTLFSVIDVYGKKQLTYKGWPLYYFIQDSSIRGLNKGISFPAPAVWPVPVKNIAAAPL
jgi:predicted lipoprotein with Yx(FWY)xxD motif